MKKKWIKIQFEYRYEVGELMKVPINTKQNPAEKENKTLERFFDLLDVSADMEWYKAPQTLSHSAAIIPSKEEE
jgi:hypothetical protein